jgi:hypothetical protein
MDLLFQNSLLYSDHLTQIQKENLERYPLQNRLINPIDISFLEY